MLPKQTDYKVGMYLRLSRDDEHAGESLSIENQRRILTNYVQENGWSIYDTYVDEGVTGCNTKHRVGFAQMVSDALAGRIDLIITKSVSRFARNTVDSLTTIRTLKEHGVEIYFEKENIWTFG